MKIKFIKNPKIKRKDFCTNDEYRFNKKTDIVPKKTNKLLCIVFSDDKGCYFITRKMNFKKDMDYFRFKKGMYIIDNESIHITSNNVRVAFYLEGISTPIKMSNVEKEILEVKYIDLYGKEQKSTIQKIKGLKFDAKILDIFANRRFAEIFTKQPKNNLQVYLLFIGIASLIMIGISYALIYFFRGQ
jgi:hypothetical protein